MASLAATLLDALQAKLDVDSGKVASIISQVLSSPTTANQRSQALELSSDALYTPLAQIQCSNPSNIVGAEASNA